MKEVDVVLLAEILSSLFTSQTASLTSLSPFSVNMFSLRETPVVLLLLRALFRAVAFARSLEGGICCTCSPLRVPTPHPTHRPSAAFGYPRPAAARQLGGSSLIGECKYAAASSSSLARRTSVWEGCGGHAVFISAECLPAPQLHCVVAVRSSVRAVRHKTAGIYHLLYKISHERSTVRPSERERGGGQHRGDRACK